MNNKTLKYVGANLFAQITRYICWNEFETTIFEYLFFGNEF